MKTLAVTLFLCIAVLTSQLFSQKQEKDAYSTSLISKVDVADEMVYLHFFNLVINFESEAEKQVSEESRISYSDFIRNKSNVTIEQMTFLKVLSQNFVSSSSLLKANEKFRYALLYKDEIRKFFGENDFREFSEFLKSEISSSLKINYSKSTITSSSSNIGVSGNLLVGGASTVIQSLNRMSPPCPTSVSASISGPGVSVGGSGTCDANGNSFVSLSSMNFLPGSTYSITASRSGGGGPSITTASTTTPGTKTPIIFIPGTLGSVIEGPRMSPSPISECFLFTQYWINPLASTACAANLRLTNNPQSLFYTPNLIAVDALRDVSILGQTVATVYKPILDMLVNRGFTEYNSRLALQNTGSLQICDASQASNNPSLFVFPYDFRKDNAETASKLKSYVQCVQSFYPPNTKIDIIAHSQGGLVARRYILQSQASGLPHGLRKVITIATPFLGASEAMYKLETGGDWDIGFSVGVISPPTIKFLVEHFPSAHQLLPSRKYFEFASFDREFGGAFYEEGDANGDGFQNGTFTFDQTKSFLDSDFSTQPGTTGTLFHDFVGQDDWTLDQSGIEYNHIISTRYSLDTTVALNVKKTVTCMSSVGVNSACSETTTFSPLKGKGDGSVPFLSAARIQWRENANGGYDKINLNQPNSKRWYMWANSTDGDERHEHNGITQNTTTHQLILGILDLGTIPAGFENNIEFPPSLIQKTQTKLTTIPSTSSPLPPTAYPSSYYFKLIGVPQAEISDSMGNHTVIDGEILTNNVNGLLSHERIGENSLFITMTTNQIHNVQFAMGNAPISLEVTKGVGNKNPSSVVKYIDLALPSGTPIKVIFSANGVENLQYDADRNGTYESTLQPTINIIGVNAKDLTSPTVGISATQQGNIGTVTIFAQDGGSGLNKIKYSINGLNNFMNYSQPFSVNTSTPITISAFAEDNVLNRSPFFTKTLFTNSITIKGRVLGRFPSIAKVFVSLKKLSTGETKKVKLNSLGYYHFDDVVIGENYVVTPIPIPNHSFSPANRSLSVNSNLDNIDFIYNLSN
jgi:Lecithin:cholesterol acyltransferase